MLNDLAVEAVGLAKSFDGRSVLRGLGLAVPRGTVFCLLGPNGAGKTTTVRILATLARADSGTARVAGLDVVTDRREVRSRISLTGQYAAVDGAQTGAENVRMAGRLAGLSRKAARLRADELLGQFGLADAAGRRAATYSGGMRRRLDLAAGLVSRPEVMFLDEPTTGLDLPGRQAVWQVVGELARSGATIFLTTQYLEEADQLADRVAVLDGGVIVADDSPAALKQKVGGRELELELADETAYEAALTCLGQHVVRMEAERLVIGLATDGSGPAVRGLLDKVDPDRTRVRRFAVHDVSMDAVFLALTTPSARATSSIPEPEEACNVCPAMPAGPYAPARPEMAAVPSASALSRGRIMIGRCIRLGWRNTDALITSLILPVVVMLMFVYLFGGAIQTGTAYHTYVVPGVLVLCAGFGSALTAVRVCEDMNGGIVDRLVSMNVGGAAIVAGHVVASALRNAVSSSIVLGVAFAIGFRTHASVEAWLGAAGLLLAFIVAVSALAAVIGLLVRSPEAANGATFVLLFLPYPSSAFVPIATMPTWIRGFARHQPATPVIESIRGLLLSQPLGSEAWMALAWCGGILLASVAASLVVFQRRISRA